MEVVQRTDDGPFGRRDVEEWSRLDELTGMLEHARVQTDRWAGVDALGGSHKYGKKVVDATKTGGAGQHRQRQQLEVFQSRVPGGALQVIRTQTASSWSHQGPSRPSTTVSSSSTSSHTRWSSRSTAGGSTSQEQNSLPEPAENFGNLEMALNPIDVSSLKMKACVGRSGSIGGRRPPSTRSRRLSASSAVTEEEATTHDKEEEPNSSSAHHLNDLSHMCMQLHEEQKRRFNYSDEEEFKVGQPLGRRFSKSSSTDDIPAEIVARDEQDEGMSSWRRGARVRRSLQFSSRDGDRASGVCVPVPATKRHSFVTVESLKEVRGRLRHLTSDQVEKSGKRNGVLKIPDYRRMDDDHDDGIASEETAAESDSPVNTLRGIKANTTNLAPKTGSLETRSSRTSAAARTDEWFNRRKSYGFEQVHNQSSERGGSITEGKKTDSADSGISRSTETVPTNQAWNDSSKSSTSNNSNEEATEDQGRKKTIITLNAMTSPNKWSEKNIGDLSPTRRRFSESAAFFRNVTSEAQVAARRASAAPKPTTITIPIVFQQHQEEERKKFSLRQIPDTSRAFTNGHSTPPPPDPETLGWASRRQLDGLGPAKRRSWAGDSALLSQDIQNYNSDCDDKLTKTTNNNMTHSMTISHETTNGGDVDTDDALTSSTTQKKTKRVEFCKTEVHFAAESGRFHIIETDGKPPPSNNFRRRKRSQPSTSNNTATNASTGPLVAQKPPLPELRFGDSIYEKKMLMTSSNNSNSNSSTVNNDTPAEPKEVTVPIEIEVEDNIEKGEEEHIYAVPNTTIISGDVLSEDSGRNTDSDDSRPRGILKKLSADETETVSEKEESKVWGVRLRPVQPLATSSPVTTVAPMWRSTVTLRSQEEETSGQMELQKLLRSLRPASSPQRHSLDLTSVDHSSPETWSVAERIRLAEERRNRGFSTKVNLGGAGETTVLQQSSDNTTTSWLQTSGDEKQTKNETPSETGGHVSNSRPLVVRIGNNVKKDGETLSPVTNGYLSLMSMDSVFNRISSLSMDSGGSSSPKYRPEAMRRASTGVLKSPSLIMQTISSHSFSPARMREVEEVREVSPLRLSPARVSPARVSLPDLGIPGQLAALRQLYEAAGEDDDSDAADREVSALMSPEDPNPPPRHAKQTSPCGGSVVSGSWSKMRAVRLSQQFHKYQPPSETVKNQEQSGFVRLKPPSESSSPLLRPVPRTRRRAAAAQAALKAEVVANKGAGTAEEEAVHSVSNKQGPQFSETSSKSESSTVQMSAATFNVPSYSSAGEGRLRAVDTLVSTRSGAPRITSISLRYDGDLEQPAAASPPASKSVTAISSPRRASSPAGGWTSPSKTTRRSLSPSSARPSVSITSRLPTSSIKPLDANTESRFSPAKTSLQPRTSLSPTKSSGLPPRGSSPLRRPASPARSPQVKVPVTAPTRRASSPTPVKKTTPPQTYFGAEVLEVEPRPEDRRGEDELVPLPQSTTTEQVNVQREVRRAALSSYRSASRGRLPDYIPQETNNSKARADALDASRARSLSPVKRLNNLVTSESPIYQNQAAISASKISPPPDIPIKSSTALIEELTRAADEILQAVNGYSDESAGSSDDDRPAPRLSALREGEVSRIEERTTSNKKTTAATSRLKKKAPTSSTSSVESLSKEARIHQRPALPCVRAQRPAVPLPGSPGQARASSSDEGGNARKQRVLRRRPGVPSSPKAERPSKEEEEANKTRERVEARAERLRTSRSRRTRGGTSTRHVEETVIVPSSKRVLAPDLSKLRAPVERIIPAAPRKSPVKTRREEHHQLTRTANGATAERRLLLIESGATSSSRVTANTGAPGLGGRAKSRGDPVKMVAK